MVPDPRPVRRANAGLTYKGQADQSSHTPPWRRLRAWMPGTRSASTQQQGGLSGAMSHTRWARLQLPTLQGKQWAGVAGQRPSDVRNVSTATHNCPSTRPTQQKGWRQWAKDACDGSAGARHAFAIGIDGDEPAVLAGPGLLIKQMETCLPLWLDGRRAAAKQLVDQACWGDPVPGPCLASLDGVLKKKPEQRGLVIEHVSLGWATRKDTRRSSSKKAAAWCSLRVWRLRLWATWRPGGRGALRVARRNAWSAQWPPSLCQTSAPGTQAGSFRHKGHLQTLCSRQ